MVNEVNRVAKGEMRNNRSLAKGIKVRSVRLDRKDQKAIMADSGHQAKKAHLACQVLPDRLELLDRTEVHNRIFEKF